MSYLLGCTGPTGAGKSFFCDYFVKKGIPVISADVLSREALDMPECKEQLLAHYGDSILAPNGDIIRSALAALAFSSRENTDTLNSITHPFIIDLMNKRISTYRQHKLTLLDLPLLFEANLDKICNKTVAIVCKKEIRLNRIMQRDNISEEQALLRMNAQHDDDYYRAKADYLLHNDSTDEAFIAAIRELESKIRSEIYEKN